MKILLACGGTGGHILPALSFLKTLELREKNLNVLLVVTKRKIENLIVPKGYKTAYISLSPILLKLDLKNLISILKLFKGAWESFSIVAKFNPDIVVGFGGYVSFFLVFFAWTFRIKTVIHEQNVIMGLSNRILAHFADRIAVSFIQTKDYLRVYRDKLIVTGNPLRPQLIRIDKQEALEFLSFSKDRSTILVMGGSLGAHKINMEFLKAISFIKDKEKFQIIHLSGTNDFDFLNKNYKDMNVMVKLFKFLDQMHYAYSAADLVICRAGALTVSELILYKLPCIIIPYPYAREHQMANARILTDRGCGILIEDKDLNAISLGNLIIKLFDNPDKINNMHFNYRDTNAMIMERSLSDVVMSLN